VPPAVASGTIYVENYDSPWCEDGNANERRNAITAVESSEKDITFAISPNPAQNELEFSFVTLGSGRVSINVLDVTGREVNAVVDQEFEPGLHKVPFSSRGLAAGVYICIYRDAIHTRVERLIVQK
jgi:hypothetical protein